MAIEQLAEVGFAQPSVDALTDLDADDVGHERGSTEPSRQIDLTEAALPEQSFNLGIRAVFPGC